MSGFLDKLSRFEVAHALITPLTFDDIAEDDFAIIKAIHQQLFFATHGFDNPPQRSGYIKKEKQQELKNLLENLGKNLDSDLITSLAEFTKAFLKLQPFAYGNSLTLRYFLTEISKKSPFTRAIDFRRIPIGDKKELLNNDLDIDLLKNIFQYSLDSELNPNHYNKNDKWQILDDSSIIIKNEHFLLHMHENTPCLVAIDGSFVAIDEIRDDLKDNIDNSGKWFAVDKAKLIGNLYEEPKSMIDGIDISGEKVPLMHLDRDYLKLIDKEIIANFIQQAFKDKQPAKDIPTFYMSMGGTGTGKSGLFNIAESEIDEGNLVIASLDNSRLLSDIYQLYLTTSHHSDDYKSLASFAKTIRRSIVEYALKNRYNLFYDGSGIEYKNRYDKIIARFKDAGYCTAIFAASAPLYIESDRADVSYPAIARVQKRMNKEINPRGVPWDVVLKKHINYPYSKFAASMDLNVDRLIVEDCGGSKGSRYILEQLFTCSLSVLEKLQGAKKLGGQALLAEIKEHNLLPETNEHSPANLADTIDFRICNLKKNKVRILVTLDKIRTLDGIQKGALNPDARGVSDLLFNIHPFHVPALDYPYDIRPDEEYNYPNRLRQTTEKSGRRE